MQKDTQEYFTKATSRLQYVRLSCRIPLSPRHPQSTEPHHTWSVSISNDNKTFSFPSWDFFVYDSKCLNCTGDNADSCTLKVRDLQLSDACSSSYSNKLVSVAIIWSPLSPHVLVDTLRHLIISTTLTLSLRVWNNLVQQLAQFELIYVPASLTFRRVNAHKSISQSQHIYFAPYIQLHSLWIMVAGHMLRASFVFIAIHTCTGTLYAGWNLPDQRQVLCSWWEPKFDWCWLLDMSTSVQHEWLDFRQVTNLHIFSIRLNFKRKLMQLWHLISFFQICLFATHHFHTAVRCNVREWRDGLMSLKWGHRW